MRGEDARRISEIGLRIASARIASPRVSTPKAPTGDLGSPPAGARLHRGSRLLLGTIPGCTDVRLQRSTDLECNSTANRYGTLRPGDSQRSLSHTRQPVPLPTGTPGLSASSQGVGCILRSRPEFVQPVRRATEERRLIATHRARVVAHSCNRFGGLSALRARVSARHRIAYDVSPE